jgi:hypothetical protein
MAGFPIFDPPGSMGEELTPEQEAKVRAIVREVIEKMKREGDVPESDPRKIC